MAQLGKNPFASYELTEQEQLTGTILTQEQTYVIQNMLAEAAIEKLNLTFDDSNVALFRQREAELHGKITTLQTILENSEVSSKIVNQANSEDY